MIFSLKLTIIAIITLIRQINLEITNLNFSFSFDFNFNLIKGCIFKVHEVITSIKNYLIIKVFYYYYLNKNLGLIIIITM